MYLNTVARVGGLNPILRNGPEAYDAEKVGPCSVLKLGAGDYRMFYEAIDVIGTPISGSDGNNDAAYATSTDGKTWTKQGVVLAANSAGWEQYELCPTAVLYDGTQYVMYYHGGNNTGPRSIGRATSPNLTSGGTWTKYGGNPILSGTTAAWDADFVVEPKVIRVGATDWRMWYRGATSEIGYARSTDGIAWTKYSGNPVFGMGTAGQWDDDIMEAFTPVRLSESDWVAYYVGFDGSVSSLGRATSSNGISWTRDAGNPVLLDATDDNLSDSVDILADGDTMRLYYGMYDLVGDTLRGKGYAENQFGEVRPYITGRVV